MSNSTFLKVALLIAVAATAYYFVSPKYAVKTVKYNSAFLAKDDLQTSEETALVRINYITGQIDHFQSWGSAQSENGKLVTAGSHYWTPFIYKNKS